MSIVGRSPLFVPTQLPGCVLWVRADQGVTVSAGGGVSQWNDLSVRGNNLTQATLSKQPTYNASDPSYNGQPTLSFLAANSQVIVSPTVSQVQPATYVYCCEVTNANGSLLDSTTATTNNIYFAPYTRLYAGSSGGLDDSSGPGFATQNIGAAIFNGASSSVYTLSTGLRQLTGGAMSGGSAATFALGGGAGGSGDPSMTGKIAEFMAFNRILNTNELLMIFRYMAARYNPGLIGF